MDPPRRETLPEVPIGGFRDEASPVELILGTLFFAESSITGLHRG